MPKLNNPEAARKAVAALQTVAERSEALEVLAWILNRHLARQREAVRAAYAALGELQPQGRANPGLAGRQEASIEGERTAKDPSPTEAEPWYGDTLR